MPKHRTPITHVRSTYTCLIIFLLSFLFSYTVSSAKLLSNITPIIRFTDEGGKPKISGTHATATLIDAAPVDWPGKALQVEFRRDSWPELRIDLANNTIDWTIAQQIAFPVSNPGTTPVTLTIHVDGTGSGGAALSRTGVAWLRPQESIVLILPLTDTDPESMGMRMGPPPNPSHIGKPVRVIGGTQGDNNFVNLTMVRLTLPDLRSSHSLVFGQPGTIANSHSDSHPYLHIVDKFGQYVRGTWPEKIGSVTDLHDARQREEQLLLKWAATLPPRDRFGGFISGPRFEATGYFRTVHANGRWHLVTPDGNPFFSLGINAIAVDAGATLVSGREFMFADLPKKHAMTTRHFGRGPHPDKNAGSRSGMTFNFYTGNLERKYGRNYLAAWRRITLARLRAWGFNTIGNWSEPRLASRSRVPYVLPIYIWGRYATIRTGARPNDYMPDVFDPLFSSAVDSRIAQTVARHKTDPFLIGYFIDNELPWSAGNDNTPRLRYMLILNILRLGAKSPAKHGFVQLLAGRYASVETFATAWGVEVSSWDALRDTSLTLSDNSLMKPAVQTDLSLFMAHYANTYFASIATALRRYDPNHLYLGSRFLSRPWEAVEACARYCDIVSFNAYDRDVSGDEWTRFHKLRKPAIVTEFQFGTADRGLFWPGLYNVADEERRGPAYTEYLDSVLKLPDIVGCHWFQYTDEPLTGRTLDGENGHIGFVSVADIPYQEFIATVRAANFAVESRLFP